MNLFSPSAPEPNRCSRPDYTGPETRPLAGIAIPRFSQLVIFTGSVAFRPATPARISLNCIASRHLAAHVHLEPDESATGVAPAT